MVASAVVAHESQDEEELPAWSLPAEAVERIGVPVTLPAEVTREWAWGGSTGAGVRVCILDSGIELDHPLVGRVDRSVAVLRGEDGELRVEEDAEGDLCGHGTACAGIVRALAPDVRADERSRARRGLQGWRRGPAPRPRMGDRCQAGENGLPGGRITYRQLDYWARTDLVVPTVRGANGSGSQRLYSFKDILVLRVVKRLLDTGVSLQNIRVAVEHLRARGVEDLAGVTLFSDGTTVYECTSPEEIVDLLQGGQGVFGIAVGGGGHRHAAAAPQGRAGNFRAVGDQRSLDDEQGTSLYGVAFAFPNYDVMWSAVDGDLGTYLRGQIEKLGLYAHEKLWDNGFRQITSSTKPIKTPDDLKGFKIRVPVSPLWTSTFQALGASPVSINFAEAYSALQTKIADGQENPLTLIYIAKFYEVQKYCAMTNHMWDGLFNLMNGKAWRALPPDLQAVLANNMNGAVMKARGDLVELNKTVADDLKKNGLVFNDTDPNEFRSTLSKNGYYKQWKEAFGPEAWALLEKFSGPLV